MRFRHIFMGFGSAVILATLWATDPDKGLMTAMFVMALVTPILAVAFAHLGRRGLFDYLDLESVAKKAQESPTGSGLVFLGVCIVIYGLLGLFGKSANAAVPTQAHQYLPMLSAEIDRTWPGIPDRAYMGGLIDHESACPIKRSCWKPTARLKSAREEGGGLGQLTRAWRADGSLRFDKLAEMREAHPALRELSWSTLYQRPDLQMRTMIVMVKADYLFFRDRTAAPLAFADASYNGGRGGVEKERRACGLKAGCDPNRWFGHVERVCLKSRVPLYGNRSACDINRHHVHDVIHTRTPRYRGLG